MSRAKRRATGSVPGCARSPRTSDWLYMIEIVSRKTLRARPDQIDSRKPSEINSKARPEDVVDRR